MSAEDPNPIITVLGIGMHKITVHFCRANDGKLLSGVILPTATPEQVLEDVKVSLDRVRDSEDSELTPEERYAALGIFVATHPAQYPLQQAWEDQRIRREPLGRKIGRVAIVRGDGGRAANMEAAFNRACRLVPANLRA